MIRRLINIKEVQARTSLSRTEIYNRMRQGTFPASVALGLQKVAWVEEEVADWIEGQVRDRGRHEEWRRWRAQRAAQARHQGSACSE
jgi:prophage regulatory protein